MTDWLPWGFTFALGTFTTLGFTLRALAAAPAGEKADLRPAWRTLVVSSIATLAVFLLYVLFGERWIWYF